VTRLASALLVVQLGCTPPQRVPAALIAGGIAAMGVSLVDLRRGPYGPGDYVMTAGLFSAVAGLVLWPRASQLPPSPLPAPSPP
jgi:hypothetical protein